jgi:uncharacterized protein YuzE
MNRFSLAVPEFAAEVEAALNAEGRESLSQQLAQVEIESFTYEARDDLGYIYFVRPAPSPHLAKLAAQVAETIVFYAERGVNVDVDHDGNLFGIELLGRQEVMAHFLVLNR